MIRTQKINKAPGIKQLMLIHYLRQFTLLMGLAGLLIVFAITSPYFFTASNFTNIGRQLVMIIIVGIGVTYVLLAGEIDLSVGSLVGMSGMVCAITLRSTGNNILIAVLLTLLFGYALGWFNGFLTVRVKIPSFLVTLAMMIFLRAAAQYITQGRSVPVISPTYRYIFGSGLLGFVPLPVMYAISMFVIFYIILTKSEFGLHIYATGGSEVATRLTGINTGKIRSRVLIISGVLSAFSGLLLAGRLAAGVPAGGSGLEFDAIIASILGGARLGGGWASLWGTVLGALLIGILSNGLVMLGLSYQFQQMVKAMLLIVVVGIDVWSRRA